jgi:hypothetical protein
MEQDETLRERFFRERRMLLGVSLVLLAHYCLGITVGKSAETLGLHFEVDNPERLWLAVWLLWGWGMFCYAVQLNSLRPQIKFPIDTRTTTYDALCRRFVNWQVRRRALASFQRQVGQAQPLQFLIETPTKKTVDQEMVWMTRVSFYWQGAPDNPAAVRVIDDTAAAGGWFVEHAGDARARDSTRGRSGAVAVRMQWIERQRWIWWLAEIWTWLSTSFATDYLAPLAIGFLPVFIAGFQWFRRCT